MLIFDYFIESSGMLQRWVGEKVFGYIAIS